MVPKLDEKPWVGIEAEVQATLMAIDINYVLLNSCFTKVRSRIIEIQSQNLVDKYVSQ